MDSCVERVKQDVAQAQNVADATFEKYGQYPNGTQLAAYEAKMTLEELGWVATFYYDDGYKMAKPMTRFAVFVPSRRKPEIVMYHYGLKTTVL